MTLLFLFWWVHNFCCSKGLLWTGIETGSVLTLDKIYCMFICLQSWSSLCGVSHLSFSVIPPSRGLCGLLLHWLLLDISSAIAVYIQYLNYAITVPADDMTHDGVMSSAGTVMTKNLHVFYKKFFVCRWCKIAFVDFSNNGITQLHKYEYFEL